MERIILLGIEREKRTITFRFSVTEGLLGFFTEKPFTIEYPENIETVPDAVAAVPFVCCVLPIIWLTDSVLQIPELDQAFYECIPNVKLGYADMFPESKFLGEVIVGKVVNCEKSATGKSAAFFSGGLDAVHTLIRHEDEKPELISIWGSDIRCDNARGWELVHNGIRAYAQKYALPDVMIKSTFREFDKEYVLEEMFGRQLKDSWWHGVKHGIGLLGHAAPWAYLKGLSTVYIASSNCPKDGKVRCASHPTIDNRVRFADCRVVHDGFQFSRQDKVHNTVDYVRRTGETLQLHVCWESQKGSNCCRCEKCCRTMAGLLVEGAEPHEFGFETASVEIPKMQMYLIDWGRLSPFLAKSQWTHIHEAAVKNRRVLRKSTYWSKIKWILNADFNAPETLRMPFFYRLRRKLSGFRFYQVLSQWKRRFFMGG